MEVIISNSFYNAQIYFSENYWIPKYLYFYVKSVILKYLEQLHQFSWTK